MSYAKRMSQLPTTRVQYLIVLAIVAAIAFSLGIATDTFRHTTLSTTADRASQVAVAPRSPALVRVPYEAGWELYDNGWAGGPAPQMLTRRAPAVVRVPYEAGWELYDGGWAGGPNTLQQGTQGQ